MEETQTIDALARNLLLGIGEAPRDYAEVMEAWRTSCPRLAVWEHASDLGLLRRESMGDGPARVAVTQAGREFLRAGSAA
jgi:hypothetical protein